MLGYEFIKKHSGEIVHCTMVGDVKILDAKEYYNFVTEHYANNRRKKEKLLLEDIPQEFLNRQMNDSRYISKKVMALLSNIVREEGEQEAKSKFVIACSGGITDRLKHDWGLIDVWNSIVYPRFERLNKLTNTETLDVGRTKKENKYSRHHYLWNYKEVLARKRIDHRHHAMDALVIACASNNIINYLNNESAKSQEKERRLEKETL